MRAAPTILAALAIAGSVARAQPAPEPPATTLMKALARSQRGEYEEVVAALQPIAEGRVVVAARSDRMEALRTYAIACALTSRPTAAEAAFLLLLREDPTARLDPLLVRPEAVALFDEVRARHRQELVAAYRKNRPRRWVILNFLPPAGQFQNRDRVKGSILAASEVLLLSANVTSGVLLSEWEGKSHDFPGHVEDARALRPLNWASFGLLASVLIYGVVDGLAVGARRAREERAVEQRLQTDAGVYEPPPAFRTRRHYSLKDGWALTF
jgi:hypothetical protein